MIELSRINRDATRTKTAPSVRSETPARLSESISASRPSRRSRAATPGKYAIESD